MRSAHLTLVLAAVVFSFLLVAPVPAQAACNQCLSGFDCVARANGGCRCTIVCEGNDCTCTVCGRCSNNVCTRPCVLQSANLATGGSEAVAWWRPTTTAALVGDIQSVSPTFATLVRLLSLQFLDNKWSVAGVQDVEMLQGKLGSNQRKNEFVEWQLTIRRMPDQSTEWSLELLGGKRYGADTSRPDRLLLIVSPKDIAWSLWAGDQPWARGWVAHDSQTDAQVPAKPEMKAGYREKP